MSRAFSSLPALLALLASACSASEASTSRLEKHTDCSQRLVNPAQTFTVEAEAGEGRVVEFTVYAPSTPGTYPLIAFSHGAYATPGRYNAMLEPLAGAGFIVMAPMHVDSEEYPRAQGAPERPGHPITWATRNEDYALALDPPEVVLDALKVRGIAMDKERTIALGHSYGALIAQLRGGAIAFEPDGSRVDRSNPEIDAVVGWSPPGAMPGFMANEGWSTLIAPSLTITGTADILPGFIDDWKVHKASYDYAPEGARALWVGEGIDHYFGGAFGRLNPVSDTESALFKRALATTLHFIENRSDAVDPCRLGANISGETYEEDERR